MNSLYLEGTVLRCTGEFFDPLNGDIPLDPTSPRFSVRPPSGTIVTYTYPTDAALVRDSVGVYHFDLALTSPGVWRYAFWSPGPTGQGREEVAITVEPALVQ